MTLSEVALTYGENPALRALDVTLFQGEMVGLLGPNGSGKSTLLHCMGGLLAPDAGAITLFNTNIASRSTAFTGEQSPLLIARTISALNDQERARHMAFLPQRSEAPPSIPAFDLALMGRYAHTRQFTGYTACDAAITLRAMKETAVEHLARRNAPTLSGGELQRVLLARALAQNTPLLLLDEPTAGLDPACQVAVLDALACRNHLHGTTIFAALHDLNLAALYCRRLIFLKNGALFADGPTRNVFTREVLEAVYEAPVTLTTHPANGAPQVLLLPGAIATDLRAHVC